MLTSLKDQMLGDTRKIVDNLARKSFKAMQVGVLTLHELNQRRRQAMKYDLLKEYRGLCSPPKEINEQLFG